MSRQTIERITEIVARADRHFDQQELVKARELFLQARAECERAGIESGYLAWRLCVVFDLLKEHQLAFKHAEEALRQDPLAPPFRKSFDIVARTMSRAIEEAQGQPDWVPRFYDLLVRAGEGTDGVHLAMARWLHGRGESKRALKLLEAVTVLSPACADAWSLRAVLCRSLGDEQGARDAEVEAAALKGPAQPPFSVPGAAA